MPRARRVAQPHRRAQRGRASPVVALDRQIERRDRMELGRNLVSPHPPDSPNDQQVMDRPVSKPVTDQVGTRQDKQPEGKGRDRPVDSSTRSDGASTAVRGNASRWRGPDRRAAPPGGTDRSSGPTTAGPTSLHPDEPRTATNPTRGASRARRRTPHVPRPTLNLE